MTTTTPPTASRRTPRPRWPWVLGSLLLLGAVGGGVYVDHRRAAQTVPVSTNTTAAAQQGEIKVSVSGPGTLEAAATRTVGADLTATVGEVPAVGERVTRGQLITTLSSDTVADNVQTAGLNLSKAQATLDATRSSQQSGAAQRQSAVLTARQNVAQAEQTLADAVRVAQGQRQLHDIGALSEADWLSAQSTVSKAQLALQTAQVSLSTAQSQLTSGAGNDAQTLRSAEIAVQQAQAALDNAQKARTDLKVYAPLSGVISTVSATEGTVVTEGSTILTILDDHTVNLPVQIDETEIQGVKVGQKAEVTLDAYGDQTFTGKVIRVSPGATQSSGISVFTATVALANPDGQLRSGMTAEAEIIQREAQGLTVPNKAIQTTRERSYVQVPERVDESGAPQGELTRVRIRTGDTDGTNTIVTSGLEAGQNVVVPGSKKASTSSGAGTTSGTSSRNRQNQGGGFGGGGGMGGPP